MHRALMRIGRRVTLGREGILSWRNFATSNSSEMTTRTRELAEAILLPDGADEGLVMKRRLALSRAITLIESQSPLHMRQADLLLNHVVRSRSSIIHNTDDEDETAKYYKSLLDEEKKRSFRVGIAGPPGSGKSSFIEAFGKFILDEQELPLEQECSYRPNKLAVVCIDPSSTITGGSILGDKTRMMDLSRHPKAFVRPSPSKGVLGGLSSYTNDVVTLCQAAGYDLVLVETVGLGQSEVDVSKGVDMLVLMVSPGGGDGLQGAKKGILEVSDMLIVNKAGEFNTIFRAVPYCTYTWILTIF